MAVASDAPASLPVADAPEPAPLSLRAFRAVVEKHKLKPSERSVIVDQALLVLEQNYVHLPFKVAMHGVNPLQQLRLLQARLPRLIGPERRPDQAFHRAVTRIFDSLRDLHTSYFLPEPYVGKFAYLPFQIEEYFVDRRSAPCYVVSRVMLGYSHPPFEVGVEVTYWNGIAIDRAVDLNAARFAGSNAAACHARGLDTLTIRSLDVQLPPDEDWVDLIYRTAEGDENHLHADWMVLENDPWQTNPGVGDLGELDLGIDLGTAQVGRAKKALYFPAIARAERQLHTKDPVAPMAPDDRSLTTSMPGFFRARKVDTTRGTFGHIRIFTFATPAVDIFIDEFVRLIGELPPDGLIIDVRGNGGGSIAAAECLLQTLTPRPIVPQSVQFAATPLNLQIAKRHCDPSDPDGDFEPWRPSLDIALDTGANFSGTFPLTSPKAANMRGQQYQGPVALITDPLCYSATDTFAAGFQDHEIGPLISVGGNTGAGGANVWTHEKLRSLLQTPKPDPDSPYVPLPKGARITVAMRRTLRVGERSGTPVEDLGVVGDPYWLTRDDILDGNKDLLEFAARKLAKRPMRRLDIDAKRDPDGNVLLEFVRVVGLERVDVFIDERPRGSFDPKVANGPPSFAAAAAPCNVRAVGYAGQKLAAACTVRVDAAGAGGD